MVCAVRPDPRRRANGHANDTYGGGFNATDVEDVEPADETDNAEVPLQDPTEALDGDEAELSPASNEGLKNQENAPYILILGGCTNRRVMNPEVGTTLR